MKQHVTPEQSKQLFDQVEYLYLAGKTFDQISEETELPVRRIKLLLAKQLKDNSD